MCRYCPKRLVGVCLWYKVASWCVDIVLRDLSECVNGTHWPAGVLILSKETCRCVPMVPNGQPVCRYCPKRLVKCVSMVPTGQQVC